MEQLYLMSEIENFYPLSAFLRTGLENWIIHHKSPNTMDVLQWAPRDSKVITKYIKVHIFWEGHKILQNLHLTFDYSTYSQK